MNFLDLMYGLLFSPLGGIVVGMFTVLILSAAICAEKEEW